MLALGVALVLAGCATTTSPTGRSQYLMYSDGQLEQMGAQAFTEMKAKQKTVSGGQQNAYVQCVVDALIQQLPAEWRDRRWETAVFVDDSPNAFALPGGKVGVNTGMFKVAKNQDQLAAVIGHEIGHVYARHTNERVSRQAATSTGLAVLGAVAG
ncbi:MAG: M48 family metallopeptidase, partial [Xanthomonadaceae bacterium]|nr:M48 family metallopeptidase [Xanthomonadaceae bacterium]